MNRRDLENLKIIRGWMIKFIAPDRGTPYRCGYRDCMAEMMKASEKLVKGGMSVQDIGRRAAKKLATPEMINGPNVEILEIKSTKKER